MSNVRRDAVALDRKGRWWSRVNSWADTKKYDYGAEGKRSAHSGNEELFRPLTILPASTAYRTSRCEDRDIATRGDGDDADGMEMVGGL